MSINGTSRELSAGESGNTAVRDIPTPPACPSWATKTSELEDQYNGTWMVEFSTFVGDRGLELAELCEYTPGKGWAVYKALGALASPVMEIDAVVELRAYAAELERCAVVIEQHSRPVGSAA